MSIKAVLYLRVSSADQVVHKGELKSSLDNQEAETRHYAESRGWVVTSVYREAGISGELFSERPALQALLEDARANRFSVVLVYNGDRIGREPAVYHSIINIIENECRIPIVDLSNPIDVDPLHFDPKRDESRLFYHSLKALFSTVDQRQRVRRHDAGMRANIAKGKFSQGIVPYGYRAELRVEGNTVNRVPVPDPKEFPYLEKIFQFAREGKTDREIAGILQSEGAPTRRGGVWGKTSVRYILLNSFYHGLSSYGRFRRTGKTKYARLNHDPATITTGRHDFSRVVEPDTYQSLLQKRQARGSTSPKSHASPNPLPGLIKCGHCGSSMLFQRRYNASKPTDRPIYRCAGRFSNKSFCQAFSIPVDEILELLFRWMNEEKQRDLAEKKYSDNRAETNPLPMLEKQVALLRKKLEASQDREATLIDSLGDGIITGEQFRAAQLRYEAERKELAGKLHSLEKTLSEAQARSAFEAGKAEFWQAWDDFYKEVAGKPLYYWRPGEHKTARMLLSSYLQSVRVKGHFDRLSGKWQIDIEAE